MPFYAVRYGNETRISGKVATPFAACKECYGLVSDNMTVKNLGNSTIKLQSDKWRSEQLKDDAGWVKATNAKKATITGTCTTDEGNFNMGRWLAIRQISGGILKPTDVTKLISDLQEYEKQNRG